MAVALAEDILDVAGGVGGEMAGENGTMLLGKMAGGTEPGVEAEAAREDRNGVTTGVVVELLLRLAPRGLVTGAIHDSLLLVWR